MSSLLFLGFSMLVFFISMGIGFTIIPMVLGAFYSQDLTIFITDASWLATYYSSANTTQWLISLFPSVVIFLGIMKVLMVATAKGRD